MNKADKEPETCVNETEGLKTREAELKYRALFEQSPDGILIIDVHGNILDFNSEAHLQLGYSREEFAKLTIADILSGESPEEIRAKIEDILRTGKGEYYAEHTTRQGEIRDVHIISRALVLGGQTVFHMIWRDITKRRKADEALHLSEKRYRAIVEIQTEFIDRHLPGGILTYVNDALARYTGMKPEDLTGKSFYPYIHHEDRDAVIKAIESLTVEKSFAVMENRIVFPDGTVRWNQWNHQAIFDAGGNVIEYQSVGRDITERKRAEEALRRSEEFIRSVLNHVDEGFLVIDRNYTIVTANKAYCAWVNRGLDQILGKHCYDVSHGCARPCYEEGEDCAVKRAFETGKANTAMHKHENARGVIMYVETKGFPLREADGTISSVIETVRNITEHHLLKEEQLKNQKLEAIGILAGGLAHDFNNLLQGVFGFISMAKLDLDPEGKAFAMLQQSEKALDMSVNLTNQLLTFSKGGKPLKKKTALGPLIESSARFGLSGSDCNFEMHIQNGLWPVDADEGQIGQVIQNIIINADQAMPGRGVVTISARNKNGAAAEPPLPGPGKWVEIVISDTGTGIREEHRSRIFDPYFTTKPKGSGLGLATAYSIVRNHDGIIDVASEVNRGSSFTICLPASEGDAASPSRGDFPSSGQKGRILVMDDDEVVRAVVGEMLNAIGHEVEFAEDGAAAIERYTRAKEAGSPFHIVILDVTVRGGMGGEEAIKRLKELDPGVTAIVSSGYSDKAIVSDYAAYGFKASLAKPFNVTDLKNVISALMKKA